MSGRRDPKTVGSAAALHVCSSGTHLMVGRPIVVAIGAAVSTPTMSPAVLARTGGTTTTIRRVAIAGALRAVVSIAGTIVGTAEE